MISTHNQRVRDGEQDTFGLRAGRIYVPCTRLKGKLEERERKKREENQVDTEVDPFGFASPFFSLIWVVSRVLYM